MKRLLWLCLFVMACQQDEADAPEVLASDAQQIGSTSVVMGAEIREVGPVKPVRYGILWDSQSDLTTVAAKNKYIGGDTSGPKVYSIKVDNLLPNTVYYYRGFAANEDYSKVYYSGIVSFTTLP